MSRALLRTAALLGSASLVLAAPAVASAAGKGHTHKPSHSKAASKKPVKTVPFAAVGTVVAVDAAARTVTVAATGGSKDLRGKTVVVTLAPTTKVTLDDAPAGLDVIDAGDAVTTNGRRVGADLVAAHVNATSAPVVQPTEQPAL